MIMVTQDLIEDFKSFNKLFSIIFKTIISFFLTIYKL